MGLRRLLRKKMWKWLIAEQPEVKDILSLAPWSNNLKFIANIVADGHSLQELFDDQYMLHKIASIGNYYISEQYDNSIAEQAKLYEPYHISGSTIEAYSYISSGAHISMTDIGRFCSIGPNLLCGWGIHPTDSLSTSPMFYSAQRQNGCSLSKTDKIQERKRIHIGNDVFIGANVTILDGVTIGDGAVIGAGAVVSKDIPPYAIAVGCPIQIIRYRFEPHIIKELLDIKWWNMNPEQLKLVEQHFNDPEQFIRVMRS